MYTRLSAYRGPVPKASALAAQVFSPALLLLLAVYGLSLAAAGAYFAVVTVNRDLPADLSALLEYQPSRKSLVFSADGEKVGQFALENRKLSASL